MCPFPSGCLPLQSLPFSKNINMLFFSQFAIPCTICHADLWHFGSVWAQGESVTLRLPLRLKTTVSNLASLLFASARRLDLNWPCKNKDKTLDEQRDSAHTHTHKKSCMLALQCTHAHQTTSGPSYDGMQQACRRGGYLVVGVALWVKGGERRGWDFA